LNERKRGKEPRHATGIRKSRDGSRRTKSSGYKERGVEYLKKGQKGDERLAWRTESGIKGGVKGNEMPGEDEDPAQKTEEETTA